MDWDNILDMEVFSNVGFWLLGGGGFLALAIGFKTATLWGNGEIGLINKVLILVGAWIASYFITKRNMS